ncbi:unnamed protein product, partial [Heterosigma akashiwo]
GGGPGQGHVQPAVPGGAEPVLLGRGRRGVHAHPRRLRPARHRGRLGPGPGGPPAARLLRALCPPGHQGGGPGGAEPGAQHAEVQRADAPGEPAGALRGHRAPGAHARPPGDPARGVRADRRGHGGGPDARGPAVPLQAALDRGRGPGPAARALARGRAQVVLVTGRGPA